MVTVGYASSLPFTEVTSPGTILHESKTIYDSQGRVERTISADGQTTDTEYDDQGRQIATIGGRIRADQVGLPANLQSSISNLQSTFVRHRTETEFNQYGQTARQWSLLS